MFANHQVIDIWDDEYNKIGVTNACRSSLLELDMQKLIILSYWQGKKSPYEVPLPSSWRLSSIHYVMVIYELRQWILLMDGGL